MERPPSSSVAFSELGTHYLQAGKWNVAGITAAQDAISTTEAEQTATKPSADAARLV